MQYRLDCYHQYPRLAALATSELSYLHGTTYSYSYLGASSSLAFINTPLPLSRTQCADVIMQIVFF